MCWISLLLAALFPAAAAGAGQRTYVGAETCVQCHDVNGEWIKGSVHENAVVPGAAGKPVSGCETCHGPGSAHIEDLTPATIRTFKDEPAAERSAACLQCHASSDVELNFRRSEHDRRRVACDECHTFGGSQKFHSMRAVGDVMAKAEPELCFGCHTEKRAAFTLPYHHPVAEGFMGCTSCHEPHGTYTPRQLRTRDTEEICGKCHEDTQGPFIFEHPAGRASGCEVCHQPHGSTNPKMLVRTQVRFLCLECHADTPPSHDVTQTRYQNCTVCHSQIHGSNVNRLLFR